MAAAGGAHEPFAHIGILVRDLDEAVERWSRLLGVTFMEARTVHVDRMADVGLPESELDLRIAFSHQGPPQYELLEMVGEGVYGAHHGEGLHHVAVLSDDVDAERARLVGEGVREVGAQYRADGSTIVAYLDKSALDGIQLELLDRSVQDAIDAWIRGEEASA